MKRKLFITLIVGLIMSSISLMAQTQKFSIQLNTGYTWFSGSKLPIVGTPGKLSYGSFINGQIPIEAELRYKVTSRFSLNFAYGYGIGLPYKTTGQSTDGTREYSRRANLSTQTFRIGEVYYFTFTKVRPYIGLDLALLLSQTKERATSTNPTTTKDDKSKIFGNFGLLPKFGVEYSFKDRMFLNFAVHYMLVVPSNIVRAKTNNDYLYQREQQIVSHGVALNVGVGYRF